MITRQAASGAVALGVKVGIALVQPIGKQPDRAEETIGKVIGKAMIAVIDIQNSARLEIDGADADASSGARLGGLEIHSGRTLRVRVHRSLPKTRPTARVFVVPGSRISLEGSELPSPAIWSAHYFNYRTRLPESAISPIAPYALQSLPGRCCRFCLGVAERFEDD